MLYRSLLRPLLFLLDAERAHELIMAVAAWLLRRPMGRAAVNRIYVGGRTRRPDLSVQLAPGLRAPNPLGLAAGFDKNALLGRYAECLGFGFGEIGTVTPRPQAGNPRPRLERIPERRAVLNRMGFNNDGAGEVAARLEPQPRGAYVLGVNVGKNKDTPNEQAVSDYAMLFRRFAPLADYFTVNVSSPNTPGLRDLQRPEFLLAVAAAARGVGARQPLFVKLAPELEGDELQGICALVGPGRAYDGVVLTNTIMTDRGGLSGEPLRDGAMRSLVAARGFLPTEAPVISVGGIASAADVKDRLKAGATAVQIYSALVYEGPGLAGRILRDLG